MGKPMIQRVWENAKRSKLIDEVLVATDDRRIFDCVTGFGGKVVMTSKRHRSGTDRIGEAVRKPLPSCPKGRSLVKETDIVVNIQGDEPFLEAKTIDNAIEPLLEDELLGVSTLAVKCNDLKRLKNPNVVKVMFDNVNNAVYFSRLPISNYKHIGLYAYRKKFLMKFIRMKPAKLELKEGLEQLRILEKGETIRVVVTKKDTISVDTKHDIDQIRQIYQIEK
jgi:3-deoxy-manno-octulosonate cytidylyltransferase (CMP-KDO synthetase)